MITLVHKTDFDFTVTVEYIMLSAITHKTKLTTSMVSGVTISMISTVKREKFSDKCCNKGKVQ